MQKQLCKTSAILFSDVFLDDSFPVTFFSYTQKNGTFQRLHYHSCFEIGICLKGSGAFFIENKDIAFHAGDVSFIFPNQPHIARSPNEYPSEWIYIDVDLDRLFACDSLLPSRVWQVRRQIPYIVSPNHCTSLARVARMIAEELEQRGGDYQTVVKELLAVFVYKLSRLSHDEGACRPAMSNAFMSVSPALVHITQHYPLEMTTEDLAKKCSLSAPHFGLLFKRAMGVAPHQYLSQFRMKIAKTLLQSTDIPILSVALSTGYQSISSFNRTFKMQLGLTPSAYRKQSRREAAG